MKTKARKREENTLIAGTGYLKKRIHGEALVRPKLGETPRSEVSVLYSQRFPSPGFIFQILMATGAGEEERVLNLGYEQRYSMLL